MSLSCRRSGKLLAGSHIGSTTSRTSGRNGIFIRLQPLVTRRGATQNSLGGSNASTRKQVTIGNDDGRVRWGALTAREKAARGTQQSFNFLLILSGAVMTSAVFYVLYREVFASESKTSQFNRAFDQVRKDRRCIELLGSSKKMKAYGEPSWNKWSRVRPIASNREKDRYGTEHLRMHFNVEGPQNKGVVSLHMTKTSSQDEFEYRYLVLDVKGHERIYLENTDATKSTKGKMKMFGVNWG